MFIKTESLTKQYGSFTALDECSISIGEGQIFGLLGPNGAGKTTLIRLLMGFLRPTHGRAFINEIDCYADPVQVHSLVAYLPGDARLFRRMKAKKVLRFFASLRPDGDYSASLNIAKRLDLNVQRRVGLMSTGMRQKLALAVTFSNSARVLVLDEPTANLDPNVRSIVMTMLLERKQQGHTILLSSHVLSEIEAACDRVVILRSGHVVHTQDMHDLRQRHRITADRLSKIPVVPSRLDKSNVVFRQSDNNLTIECEGDLAPLLDWLAQLKLENVRIEPMGLQAVYDRYHSAVVE